MTGAQWFQLGASVLGLLGVLAAAFVIMRSTVMSQNNTQLRNAYRDLRDQFGDQESRLAKAEAERDELRSQVATLSGVVTGRSELEALTREVHGLAEVVRGAGEQTQPWAGPEAGRGPGRRGGAGA